MPKIVVKRKNEIYKEYLIRPYQSRISIGSDGDNDLIISDSNVANHHLLLKKEGSDYFLENLDPDFYTLVNGNRLSDRSGIVSGDTITLGDHALFFENSLFETRAAVLPSLDPENDRRAYAAYENDASTGTSVENREAAAPPPQEITPDNKTEISPPVVEKKIIPVMKPVADAETIVETTEVAEAPEQATVEFLPHYLLVIHGPYLGKKYQLNFGVTKIGRDKNLNDIQICETPDGEVDTSISRRHASIIFEKGNYFLMDKRSKTRTRLNKHELKEDEVLQLSPGDEIEITSDQQSTIFRFVRQGREYFGRPRKSGYWWIRNRRLVGKAVSLIAVLVSALLIIHSFGKLTILRQQPRPLKFSEMLFYQEKNEHEILLSREEILASGNGLCPATADLNGDSFLDLVYLDKIGYLKVIDGKTKQDMWSSFVQYRLQLNTRFVLADMNGNDLVDVILPAVSSKIFALDGKTGVEIWASPILGGNFLGAPLIANLNGDRFPDVVICSRSGLVHIGYGQFNEPQWTAAAAGVEITNLPAVIDVDNDRSEEIIFATADSLIRIFNPLKNEVLPVFNVNDELKKVAAPQAESQQIRQPIAVAAMNRDQFQDLILLTEGNFLLAYDVHQKKAIWFDALASSADSTAALVAPPLIADLNNDGRPEVLVITQNNEIINYEAAGDGSGRSKINWKLTAKHGWQILAPPALADINKDKIVDVLLVDFNQGIYIFNGTTGTAYFRADSVLAETEKIITTPLVADFNNDGWLDILYRKNNETFNQLKTNSRVFPSAVFWGQAENAGLRNKLASNLPGLQDKFYVLLFGAIIFMSLVLYLNFRAARNWRKHFRSI